MNKKAYLEKRKALLAEAQKALDEDNIEAYNAKETEIKNLDEQYEKSAKAMANFNALKDVSVVDDEGLNLLSPNNKLEEQKKNTEPEDKYNTVEYRKAFMNYCKTGAVDKQYMNLDAYTGTEDAGAVIPTNITNEIIKKAEGYGQIYNKVRKTNIKGGMQVPILSLKPTATWITEAAVSDRKNVTANTSVQFSYYGLECKVAVSLLANVTTLDMFETTITQLIVEAIVKALDISVIKGSGEGEPLGITVDPRVTNVVTLSAADFLAWDGWKKKVFAKIPLSYRAGGSFIMASGTFEGYIDGMVDANGQPIGRVNYGIANGPQERFGGREVILVEDDVIAPYESASTGDIVAVFCKLSDYCINSNMQMTMYRWLDHDTNQWVDKAILIADGKILDPEGVIVIKKGA